MGAASGDLPGMAAQPRHLARQVRGDPAGVRADGGSYRGVRAAAPAGRGRGDGRGGARGDTRGGGRGGAPGSNRVHHIATNDSWIRDHGPIFINRAAPGDAPAQVALDFGFNSWGEKYGAFDLDDAVPRRLGERFGFEVVEPPMVLEGGSIDVDGAGTLLTTESCLLNPNRNPALDRAEIERQLKYWLGVSSVLWLGEGIAGDDTDGHVDDLARFVAPATVVTVTEDDRRDENYHVLADNLKRLRAMRDADGTRAQGRNPADATRAVP